MLKREDFYTINQKTLGNYYKNSEKEKKLSALCGEQGFLVHERSVFCVDHRSFDRDLMKRYIIK